MRLSIASILREIVAALSKLWCHNIEQTWNAPDVQRNPDAFIKVAQLYITRLYRELSESERDTRLNEIQDALNSITGGSVGMSQDGHLFKKLPS